MEGLGNDYIYIDAIHQHFPVHTCLIQMLSDRHFGIGSDGVILILPSKSSDFKMRIFNRDGSEARMCGNGIRCVAKYCYEHHLTNKRQLHIETIAGVYQTNLLFHHNTITSVRVDMGKPSLLIKDMPIHYAGDFIIHKAISLLDTTYYITAVMIGTPHIVFFVDDISVNIQQIADAFMKHELYDQPINIEFVKVDDKDHIKMRVWERGSDETLACGTGACAALYACYMSGHAAPKGKVEMLGGVLDVSYLYKHMHITGSADTVFEGTIEI